MIRCIKHLLRRCECYAELIEHPKIIVGSLYRIKGCWLWVIIEKERYIDDLKPYDPGIYYFGRLYDRCSQKKGEDELFWNKNGKMIGMIGWRWGEVGLGDICFSTKPRIRGTYYP